MIIRGDCMRKYLFIIVCVLFSFSFCIKTEVLASEEYVYQTSDGNCFTLDDVLIYEEDLIDKTFENETELIDYIYNVGYNRTSICDDTYEIYGQKVTKAELALALDGRYSKYVSTGFNDSKIAKQKTQELFGYNTDDTKANAFQHAYWIMLMYFHTTPDFSIKEAYAHEEYDGNNEFSKHMDLYNDDRAYEKASTISYQTDEELAKCAKELVDSGKLIYIKRNYSYLKEKIYHSTTGKIEMIYATGDFYCYTNSNTPFGVPETKITRVNYEIMQGSLVEV